MELILKEPIEKLVPKLIAFNNEELKNQLLPQLQNYKNIVYTEEQISTAKADRANLNKLKTAIDDERKRIKKIYLDPYNHFESQVKEIVTLVEDTSNVIDSQVKRFEEEKKNIKKMQIIEFWNEKIDNLADLIDINTIFNDQWLNATYSLKKVQEDIEQFIKKANQDLEIISNIGASQVNYLKDFYLRTFDITKTLQEKTRLEEQEKKLQELSQKTTQQDTNKEVANVVTTEAETKVYDFRITATRQQVELLKEFLIKNNIKYGKVPTKGE